MSDSGDLPRMNRPARRELRRLRAAPGMTGAGAGLGAGDSAPTAQLPVPASAGRARGSLRLHAGLPVPAADGSALLTDHWAPRAAEAAGGDTVLIRTPYPRANHHGLARFLAERGLHVVVQSCRGTDGSAGVFRPLRDEAADGAAALAWLRAQDWATGRILTYGFSYAGYTQWALCDGEDRPDAMVIGLSSRRFEESFVREGGGFATSGVLAWALALQAQATPAAARWWSLLRFRSRLHRAVGTLPLRKAPRAALGNDVPFVREWLEHGLDDPWWEAFHAAKDLRAVPPVTLLAGWQDVFLRGGTTDFSELAAAGTPVRLLIGDWTHHESHPGTVAVRELLRIAAAPAGTALPPGPAVRIEITGGGMRDLSHWPPGAADGARVQRLTLTAEHGLIPAGDQRSEHDQRCQHDRHPGAGDAPAKQPSAPAELRFRFDPADPTPAVGGRSLDPFAAGRRDQSEREHRDDVLIFTGPVLVEDLVVAGESWADLALASTNPGADIHVRLCDVDPAGVSRTVADGYVRTGAVGPPLPVEPAGSPVGVPLDPVAHRFAAGHRLRLQVAAGAHPLHQRHHGTEEALAQAETLRPSVQRLLIGGPSAFQLSVLTAPAAHSPAPVRRKETP